MDIFLDAFCKNCDNSFTVDLNDATEADIMKTAMKLKNNLAIDGHCVSYFEVWPRNKHASDPISVYTVIDIDNYFNFGIKNCKSIW